MQTNTQEELHAVEELIQGINPNVPSYAEEEAAVAELVIDLRDAEAFAIAYDALKARVTERPLLRDNPALRERLTRKFEDIEFDSEPLIETTPDRLFRVNERLMDGQNPLAIIRAEDYEDFEEDILGPLLSLNGFHEAKNENFPRRNDALGHSRVHLDNFADEDTSHFRYGMSVSRVKQGRVVVVAGLAAPSVKSWGENQYQMALRAVNNSNVVNGLRDHATDSKRPSSPQQKRWEPHIKGVRGEFVATTLNPGDVAIWPQGAAGAKLPSWHGFIQVGNPHREDFTPRQSTSYHLS